MTKQDHRTEEHRAQNRERMRRYRERHPERVKASRKKWHASHKDYASSYNRQDRVRQKKREWNLAHPGYNREYERKNRDRIRFLSRQWAKRNLDKIRVRCQLRRAVKRKSEGSYTLLEWQVLCRKYDFRCLACGKREPDIKLTVDHIIPLNLGGSNYIDNLQPLCLQCNSTKGAQFIDYRPEVTKREQYEQLTFF